MTHNGLYNIPWAILPSRLPEIRARLATVDADLEDAGKPQAATRRGGNVQMIGRVAVVPVFGIISQRIGLLEQFFGVGVSTEALGATLDSLVQDNQVRAIVLVFDSDGGSVLGTPELAAKIRGYRGQKKVVGSVDSYAASGAYWLASQAEQLYMSPSAMVGSIGVFMVHDDISKALEADGVKLTIVGSTPEKSELFGIEPLSEAARADLQAKVDAYYKMFVDDVARGRGVTAAKVRADFGGGRMLQAAEALAAGMVDKVLTLEQVLKKMGAQDGPTAQVAQAQARARSLEI